MAEMREAKSESSNKRGSYKKLEETTIKPIKGENGGHLVTHRFSSPDAMGMPKTEEHMFGKDGYSPSGTHILEHLSGKHKIPMPEAHEQQTAEPSNEVESASEPASEDVNA
jgi:hypothetical protein